MTQTVNDSKDFEMIKNYNVLTHGLYTIVDFKSLSILPPFLAQNDDEAIRNFTNMINYSNSMICRFPDDFKLYKICDFIVSYTGNTDSAREQMISDLLSYQFIASADLLKADDTVKYDALNDKVENALKQVSNSNQVLVEQIGKVPNLNEQINLINSRLTALIDEFEHFKNQDNLYLTQKKIKKSFLDRLFN